MFGDNRQHILVYDLQPHMLPVWPTWKNMTANMAAAAARPFTIPASNWQSEGKFGDLGPVQRLSTGSNASQCRHTGHEPDINYEYVFTSSAQQQCQYRMWWNKTGAGVLIQWAEKGENTFVWVEKHTKTFVMKTIINN